MTSRCAPWSVIGVMMCLAAILQQTGVQGQTVADFAAVRSFAWLLEACVPSFLALWPM